MTKIEPRVRWLEQQARNPYANDPRMAAFAARLQAGASIQTVSDDDLNYAIAWFDREGWTSLLDVAAMSDGELERAAEGDASVLARYRTQSVEPTATTRGPDALHPLLRL